MSAPAPPTPSSPSESGRHDSSGQPEAAPPALGLTRDLQVCAAVLLVVSVAGKMGDALAPTLVGRCRLTVSTPVLKKPMVSALATIAW